MIHPDRHMQPVSNKIACPPVKLWNGKQARINIYPAETLGAVGGFQIIQREIIVGTSDMNTGAGNLIAVVSPVKIKLVAVRMRAWKAVLL